MKKEIIKIGIISMFLCFQFINCNKINKNTEIIGDEDVEISSGKLPCPEPSLILPCVCTVNETYLMVMNCSDITSDEDLWTAFNHEFPFYTFYTLLIEHNPYLTSLTPGVFGELTFMEVYIQHNDNFSTVDLDAFLNMEETMTYLTIRYCPLITEIVYDFTNYIILDRCDLDRNSILFVNITSPTLRVLGLGSNSMTNGQLHTDAPNLERLNLSSNNLTEVADLSKYPILYYYSMARNLIENVSAGTLCFPDTLIYIYLQDNAITEIEEGSICVQNGSNVLLNKNYLTTLNETVYGSIVTKVAQNALAIMDNPFVCGCDIAWIITNSTNMDKLYPGASCSNGELFTELDPAMYEFLC